VYPNWLTARQYQFETQDTDVASTPSAQPNIGCQLVPSKSIASFPTSGTATQNVVDTHDTDTDCGWSNTEVGPNQVEPLYLNANPRASNAMQKVDEVHDTDAKSLVRSIVVGADQVAPFHVTTPPSLSTAAQNPSFGQLTESSRPPIKSATIGEDQLDPL
jgi:hypothetical protein